MSVTSGLSDWLAAQGIWCPEGDGDTLRTAAAAWTAMGVAITDIAVTLDAAATTLGATTSGSGTSTFGSYWTAWQGDAGYLGVSAAYCNQLAGALSGFATDVDVASNAVLEGIEWAITSSNLTGPSTFTAGVIPEAVPAGITPAALAELKAAIEEYALTLGAAAQSQAASAGVTAIDPNAPPATAAAPVTTTTTTAVDVISTPLSTAPDLGSLATTVLDFGAGQGQVLDPTGAPVPLAAITTPTSPLPTDPSAQPVSFSTYDPTAALPPSSAILTAPVTTSNAAKPTAMLAAALGIGKAVRAAAGSAAAHSSKTAGVGGGGGGGGAMPSFSAPPLAKIPTSKFGGTPISVPPPSAATLAAEKAAADAAKAAMVGAKTGSGSMPFMPMGMGGAGAGGGGDDRDEARRKKRR